MQKMKKKRRNTYNYWVKMKSNPEISVCCRWNFSFHAFVEDIGNMPTKHHVIRIKTDERLYCKRNCEWIDNDVLKEMMSFCDPNYLPNWQN